MAVVIQTNLQLCCDTCLNTDKGLFNAMFILLVTEIVIWNTFRTSNKAQTIENKDKWPYEVPSPSCTKILTVVIEKYIKLNPNRFCCYRWENGKKMIVKLDFTIFHLKHAKRYIYFFFLNMINYRWCPQLREVHSFTDHWQRYVIGLSQPLHQIYHCQT